MNSVLNYQLPENWTETELRNLIAPSAKIIYGIIQPGIDVANGVPFVRGGDICDGKIDIEHLRTIAPEISQNSHQTELKGGELLMSLVGSPGEVAIVPPTLAGANVARQVAYIRLGSAVDHRYVMYYLQSDLGKYYLFQKSTGSAQQVINLLDLKNVNIITAPLPEQKKIAAVLACVDDLLEVSRSKLNKLKDLKSGMLQELLTRDFGHSDDRDSLIGRIPANWNISTLQQVATNLQTGPFGSQLHAHEYVAQGIPVVMPRDMENQTVQTATVARITPEKAKELARYRLETGDILFSRRGDVGRCALVREDNAGWICGTGCLKVTLNTELLNPDYFIYYLTLSCVVEWLNNNAVGQTMLNLNTSILADLPVVIPPINEQRIIADAMRSLDNALLAKQAKIMHLTHIKKSLIQDLLTGKVRSR